MYDADNVILELDGTNNQVATNTYGLKLLKRTTDKEGFYLYNGHGDVTKILDNTNTTLNSYVYDEFGKILFETETFNNPFKYAGYYYDKETKTYYLQARYYNPEIQRFISEDTYRGELDDPLSLNLYTYCANNPLIYTDPSGHWFEINDIVSIGFNVFKLASDLDKSVKNVSQKVDDTMSEISAYWNMAELSSGKSILTDKALNQSEIYEKQENAAIIHTIESTLQSYSPVAGFIGCLVPPCVAKGLYKVDSVISKGTSDVYEKVFTKTKVTQDVIQEVTNETTTKQLLEMLASKSDKNVSGNGAVSGTLKHSEFKKLVDNLNNKNLKTEITYKDGEIVSYGTKGGVRLDVVEYYEGTDKIKAIYDLKTGKAKLTNNRISQIQGEIDNYNIPVREIRP